MEEYKETWDTWMLYRRSIGFWSLTAIYFWLMMVSLSIGTTDRGHLDVQTILSIVALGFWFFTTVLVKISQFVSKCFPRLNIIACGSWLILIVIIFVQMFVEQTAAVYDRNLLNVLGAILTLLVMIGSPICDFIDYFAIKSRITKDE